MSLYRNSKQKIRNVRRTIEALADGDFPYQSGQKALKKLSDLFVDLDKKLDRAQRLNDTATLGNLGHVVTLKIYQCLPILGFVLRSTNVRNAFEYIEPLQNIASLLLLGKPEL